MFTELIFSYGKANPIVVRLAALLQVVVDPSPGLLHPSRFALSALDLSPMHCISEEELLSLHSKLLNSLLPKFRS